MEATRTIEHQDGRPARTEALLEEGRDARLAVPRTAHAGWVPPPGRRDPVAILEEQAATRVPELVPIRYGRMAVSPFAFFRGGAAIMAADLGSLPATSLRVQCCGDAHLSNFGAFAAPDRRLVFDLNDFDETIRAPFEWDVKRLAASLAVATRENRFGRGDQWGVAELAVRSYQAALAEFARLAFLDVWYSRVDVDPMLDALRTRRQRRRFDALSREVAQAHRRTNLGALRRYTHRVGGSLRIRAQPPVVVPLTGEQRPAAEDFVHRALSEYVATLTPERRIVLRHYRFVDMARKVSGVGSVGTEGYMVLLMGERDDDPLFLQVKEAQESVLAPYVGPGVRRPPGERVVRGQRIMQATGDSFLGWYDTPEGRRHFYVRQLRDKKGSADVGDMRRAGLKAYARLCGGCLARAHARSDEIARLSGYVGTSGSFAQAIARFAVDYADQNERDHAALLEAEREGRIVVQRGV